MHTSDNINDIPLAAYLFLRLRQLGIESVHGVPGDFNLVALDFLEDAGLHWVGDANELNAGYAADGYARVKGMGALVTTFGVGELSAINAIAGSYAEYVPVVHIVGSPTTIAQKNGLLLHHTLGNGDFGVFADMYKRVTCAQARLHDITTACRDIDNVLQKCWMDSRPVYIELPADMVRKRVSAEALETVLEKSFPTNDPEAESIAVNVILSYLYAAQKPCILVDGCAVRRHVKNDVGAFIRKTGLPVFISPMGKSGVDETLPNFGGMYSGSGSYDSVRNFVESSDCVIAIGTVKSDFNTTGFTCRVSKLSSIDLHSEVCHVGHASYNLRMKGVIQALTRSIDVQRLQIVSFKPKPGREAAKSLIGATGFSPDAITHDYLWTNLSQWLRPGDILLTEAGTSSVGVWDTVLPRDAICISQPLWGSIGFTLGAAQGAAQAAREVGKGQRVVLFEGDGSLQMTVQSIGTMLGSKLDLILIVVNNDGYTIERWIHGMDAVYNDIPRWKYCQIPGAMGATSENTTVYKVETRQQLVQLWSREELISPKGLHFVEMLMPREDAPVPLKMIGAGAERLNAGS